MARRVPEGPPPPPVVQRVRLRYAKRGRLRFSSHRDFARAFERALRRAEVPMGYSAGFTPHPKISYIGAAPTGAASEAEFVEIGLVRDVDPERLRAALDAALPDGLDVVEAVVAGPGGLAERIEASLWHITLPGVDADELAGALATFLAADRVEVERMTKNGRRTLDARGAVVSADARRPGDTGDTEPDRPDATPADPTPAPPRAILDLVVRQETPTVRPDDVLAALRSVAGLAPGASPVAVRVAQGPLDGSGRVGDPLTPDRDAVRMPSS